jgi:hypothetical protein
MTPDVRHESIIHEAKTSNETQYFVIRILSLFFFCFFFQVLFHLKDFSTLGL